MYSIGLYVKVATEGFFVQKVAKRLCLWENINVNYILQFYMICGRAAAEQCIGT